MPVSDHSIGERVKLLRSQKGWSQTDLAQHTGVTQSAISGIENGRSQGRLILGKLAAAFGITYEELSTGDAGIDHPIDNEHKILGDRLKQRRLALNLTQQDICNLFDPPLQRASISKWESGAAKPEIEKLPTLAKFLNVSIAYLIDGSSDNPNKPQQQDNIYLLGRLMAFESVCKCIASQNPEMMDLVAKLLMNLGINTQAILDIKQHEIEDLKIGWESALMTLVKKH